MTLRIKDVTIPVMESTPESSLPDRVAEMLGIAKDQILRLSIMKRSLDARRKSRIVFHYMVNVDLQDEQRILSLNQSIATEVAPMSTADPIEGVSNNIRMRHRPIIIGSGPAGTYAALTLSLAGVNSLIIDRGEAVEQRLRDTNQLRSQGILNPESNYCFGEGGAGTFSDGKLTCGRNHPLIRHVFDRWVEFGAPEEIQWDAKPHIGTDNLMRIAINMRRHLEQSGTQFVFGRRFVDFKDGGTSARYLVKLDSGEEIPTDHLILAVGHSARDTYQMLLDKGVAIVPKPFAVGARIEHPQEQIDKIQFGSCQVPTVAEYKLAEQVEERGIWTFCMCPGGFLLPTSAQPGKLAINGMSYHARGSGYANAAVVVNVRREDFFKGHPLDGMRFQEKIESKAFAAGGSDYHSPAQRLEDFLAGRESRGEITSTYKPGVRPARMDKLLPPFIVEALKGAVVGYNKKMRGYISDKAIIAGVESKTSAPIAMTRNDQFESVTHPGFYPTGEGAGFAGGIVSAALDGVRVARAILMTEGRE